MKDWDDNHLVEACLAGNEQAWEVLIERYNRLIYTVPLRFGLSRSVADEIFQETCLILLEKLATLRERDRLSSWLVTITRRACIQRWRHPQPYETVELENAYEVAEDEIEDDILRSEQQHLLRQAVENLKPRCRWLLKALFFEIPPPSYDDISLHLDLPVGSIGPTRSRCLKKLRQEFLKLQHGEKT